MPFQPSLRSRTRVAVQLAAALVLSIAARPADVRAQNVTGSIGVSLTVLQPVATESVELLGVEVDRAGMATIAMTAPVSGPASQLVMTSVASSTTSFVAVQQAPSIIRARGAAGGPARLHYLVEVGPGDRAASEQRPVEVRIKYLAVAGT